MTRHFTMRLKLPTLGLTILLIAVIVPLTPTLERASGAFEINGAVTWSSNQYFDDIVVVKPGGVLTIDAGVTVTFKGKQPPSVEGKSLLGSGHRAHLEDTTTFRSPGCRLS